jgi:hypothetical protein
MDPFNGDPRPEEFPLGSPESRAAARLLVEKRNAALIPVMTFEIIGMGPPLCFELNPNSIGRIPHCWMTRQELEMKQRERARYDATWREEWREAQIERERSPESTKAPVVTLPDVPPVPRRETDSRAAAASQKQNFEHEPESELDASEKRVRLFIEERIRPVGSRSPPILAPRPKP